MHKNGNPALEKANAEISRKAAAQSMVLLKNTGSVLPLIPEGNAPVPVAVFGVGQLYTVKGGTGSGDVNSVRTVTILEGLRSCSHFKVDETVAGSYEKWVSEHPQSVSRSIFGPERISNEEMPTDGGTGYEAYAIDMDAASCRNAAAVIVITRNSGEGRDIKPEAGEYYLDKAEQALLDRVSGAFVKIVLVLNVGGVIDTGFIDERISAVLLASLPGQEAGHSVADILSGKTYPSGKLTDTWALNYGDYSSSRNFGGSALSAFETKDRRGVVRNQVRVAYEEGIYVGYRYFDTFGKDVAYPFGYGLTYTQFALEARELSVDGSAISLTVTVRNTGKRIGREVVQVYCSAPDGKLEKPYQALVGFAKTGELLPGESETVTVRFSAADMASYDEDSASYILEAGYYDLRVGNSSRNTAIAGSVLVKQTLTTAVLKNCMVPTDRVIKEEKLRELSKAGAAPITYAGEDAQRAEARKNAPVISWVDCVRIDYSGFRESPDTLEADIGKTYTFGDLAAGKCSIPQFAAQLSLHELANLACGTGMDFSSLPEFPPDFALFKDDAPNGTMIGSSATLVKGAAGQTTSCLLEKYGVPQLVLADGPAGVRLTQTVEENGEMFRQNCTAFPVGMLLASSWDESLAVQMGGAVADEMLEYGVDIWLAPGMNIHRNPLCGRNFEYFSEDPLLSGRVAAGLTRGVQRRGVGVTLKHFAANDQETDREFSDSVVSERALREIYLKGFEIAVKLSAPVAIMTSYNNINGIPAADNFDLCTRLARAEWGFDGFIMTDWGGGLSTPALSMYAGNDMIQPGKGESIYSIMNAVTSGKAVRSRGACGYERVVTLGMLQRGAVNILKVILKLRRNGR